METEILSDEARRFFSECGRRGGGRPPKLTKAQREDIKRRADSGEARADLAKEYGIGNTTVGRIVRGRR